MIKYLGSKRRLVPVLVQLADIVQAHRTIDLFTGSARVAAAFRASGREVTAVDVTRYSEVIARAVLEFVASPERLAELEAYLLRLNAVDGVDGYVTETFCRTARYFTPENGMRIDAIRAAVAADHAGTWTEAPLLTALIQAADRVDSTVGVQMAYLKQWAPRALHPLVLRMPVLPNGPVGRVIRGDARSVAGRLPACDLAYLDPPYNQHRYEGNYHVWETIAAGDAPDHYGVACKRTELRERSATSAFNRRNRLGPALASCVASLDARVIAISYNDESWLTLDDLVGIASQRGPVTMLEFDSARYVGARIGIHDPGGQRVGTVGRLRNVEYLAVTGDLTRAERKAIAALSPERRPTRVAP